MVHPTDNSNPIQIAVRFDTPALKILDKYCEKENIVSVEGVRQAVRKLNKK